ncbi:unnamed protein product [Sphagnum balticum]
MNHAADDPLPPFTSQKPALLTTKIAAKSRLLPLPAQASGGGYPAADEGAVGRAGRGGPGPGARGGTEDDDEG